MRAAILAATALAAVPFALSPLPATAQDQASTPADPAMEEMTDRMSDPVEQEKMAAMVNVMGQVLMELPVGPLLDAVAQMPGADVPQVEEGATMRDLAGPDADRLPGEISEKVPMMMGMLSGMLEGLSAMRPVLEGMAETMESRIESAGES